MSETPLKPLPEYFTLAEAARLIGAQPRTIRRWCELGHLRGRRWPASGPGAAEFDNWIIESSAVIELLTSRYGDATERLTAAGWRNA